MESVLNNILQIFYILIIDIFIAGSAIGLIFLFIYLKGKFK
jgi:hypothetical protein